MKSTHISVLALVLMVCPAIADAKVDAVPKLKLGEQYRLSIRGIPEAEKKSFNGLYRIDSKGCITIPFAGQIKVDGMTVEQAEKAMENSLKKREFTTILTLSSNPQRRSSTRKTKKRKTNSFKV